MPVDTLADDPLLLPLADNGGPTMTHAFDMSSPRWMPDRTPTTSISISVARAMRECSAPAADIGAFEAPGAIPDEIFASGFD